MRTAGVKVLAAAFLVLVVAGCGNAPAPASVAYRAHGLEVELPPGWQPATATLTPHLLDPREELSAGTFPLRYRDTGCAHMPSSALADIGPTDAFVTIEERGTERGASWEGFPPRPAHFGPQQQDRSEASECAPGARFTDHFIWFTDGDRHFHVLVAFGPQASAATRDEAWGILDSLRVDPQVRPDWSSAG
jgi:hypothetical protein